jgi:hypothetical protein
MGDGTASRFDPKGKGRSTPKNDELSLDLNAVEGGSANGHADGAFMQMQLVEQQVCFSHREKFPCDVVLENRIHTFNNARLPLSPLKPPSPNSAKFSLSSLIWSRNNEKQSSELTKTSLILRVI